MMSRVKVIKFFLFLFFPSFFFFALPPPPVFLLLFSFSAFRRAGRSVGILLVFEVKEVEQHAAFYSLQTYVLNVDDRIGPNPNIHIHTMYREQYVQYSCSPIVQRRVSFIYIY